MIRVVVADDQALVRGGFRVLVDSAPDLEVAGEAADVLICYRPGSATAPRPSRWPANSGPTWC